MEIVSAFVYIGCFYIIAIVIRWAYNRYRNQKLLIKYGIPGPKPHFLMGNLSELKEHPTPNGVITQWLNKFGNVFGYYIGGIPYIVVNDVEMLKQIMVKDFHVFVNRPELVIDFTPIDKSIIAQEGKRWKEVRALLTPTFSSGKIKFMTNIVKKKVDVTVQEISKKAEKNEIFDIYNLFQGLTLDVIADCAFAMKTHCQENSTDQFLIAVQDFFRYSHNRAIDYAIMFPFIATLMGKVFKFMTSGRMTRIIVNNVATAIEVRQRNPNIRSVDILQLMLDHKNDEIKGMTDEEIVANAYIFLLAGYETTSTALSFTFYLLVTHPEIQERLRQEVDTIEDINYSTIQNLQYLDQVFHESLRLYPPLTGFISRSCAEDYKIGTYTFPKGSQILAPVWDIHHNPDFYTDPWKFNPDRFSPENKKSLNNMAFLPFGLGHRNCIGARFAQLEAKLAICQLLRNFKFEMCEKTDHPIHLICPTVVINPANGVWLKAIPRDLKEHN